MARSHTDQLFERYRSAGDAAAMAEVFEATSKELYEIALHLVRDPARADDLVQDTYITAIERAWSWDKDRPLVPWLVGILTMCARRERRQSARAIENERLAHPTAGDPARDAAGAELELALTRALAAVPERYREVLDLHLAQGKRTLEIASELSRAPGTVRVQIHRGLEMLRKALPGGFALGGAALLAGTRGEAAVRAAVLDHARSRAPELVRRGAELASVKGASSLVPWLVCGALALAALLILPRLELGSSSAPAVAPAPPLAALGRALESETARALARSEASTPSTPRAALDEAPAPEVAPPAAGLWLELSVADAPAAGEITFVLRTLEPGFAPLASSVPSSARVSLALGAWYDAMGRLPAEFFVIADHAERMPVRQLVFVTEGERERLARTARGALERALQLAPPLARVRGEAHARRESTGQISVALFGLEHGKPRFEPEEALLLEAGGSFQLRSAHSGPHVVVVAHPSARPESVSIELEPAGAYDLPRIELGSGVSLAGSVVDEHGQRAGASELSVRALVEGPVLSLMGRPLVWSGTSFEHALRTIACEPDGSFFVSGLSPVRYAVEASSAHGTRSALVELVAPSDVARLVLQPAAPAGAAQRVRVQVLGETETGLSATVTALEVDASAAAPRSVNVPDNGALELELEPGRYRLLIHARGVRRLASFVIPHEQELVVDSTRASAPVTVFLQRGGKLRFAPPSYSGSARELDVRLVDAAGASITLQLAHAELRPDARAGHAVQASLALGTPSLSQPLRPGSYELQVGAAGSAPFVQTVELTAGEETVVSVRIDGSER